MISVSRADIELLLNRHGIESTSVGGSDTRAAAKGGRIATIAVRRIEDGSVISMTVGEHRVEGPCPLDEAGAASMVEALRAQQQLPARDASFERMVVDLLLKISELYVDSGANSLTFESVHLHPTSYHVERVAMLCETPPDLKPRRESPGIDRRATFAQRHRSDQRLR